MKLIPTANVDLNDVMVAFNQALGVQCSYCHTPGDFASDANPMKDTARKMITMVRQTEMFFPSSNAPFPRGYHEVDCMTCHLGKAKPVVEMPVYFQNKREALGPPPPIEPGVNLKVLPADTQVHGKHSIMEEFRDALNVDCAFCHGGTGTQADDSNPRKDITRRMIEMQRRINTNFPGTGVYPQGPQVVTCNMCHRGNPHPASLSNVRYSGPVPPVP